MDWEHEKEVQQSKKKSIPYEPYFFRLYDPSAYKIYRSTDFEDRHYNIDFWIVRKYDNVKRSAGFRVMHSWIDRYKYDFGIRYSKPKSEIVEYNNVIEKDYCDYYFYGLASYDQPKVLDYWFYLDMRAFRKQIREFNNVRFEIKENRKKAGHLIIFYRLNSLYEEPKVVLKSNYKIPHINKQDEILTV